MSDEITENGLEFDLPKHRASVIKVIGVGGGGSNAVNHMQLMGINGVDFIVCNTDAQALDHSPVQNRIQLGANLTEGLGAGANPDVGRRAAEESEQDVMEFIKPNTKMVFITAGMGGGTGTGAAPVIARFARELNILTVGIVTNPFRFEGKVRAEQARKGIEELRENVDSLIVINNDKLREVYGNLSFRAGFAKADEVLATAAKGIAEVITYHYTTNIDLRDVRTVLEKSGTAIMGSGKSGGTNRAEMAVKDALDSPLLNDNHIQGSKNVLLMIVSNGNEHEITMDEMGLINDYIQEEAGGDTNVIMGIGIDDELGEEIAVTVIATGFPANRHDVITGKQPAKIVHPLEEEQEVSRSVYHRPFAETESPDKPLKKDEEKSQPDLFSAVAPKNDAVVHALYDEQKEEEVDAKAINEPMELAQPLEENTIEAIDEIEEKHAIEETVGEVIAEELTEENSETTTFELAEDLTTDEVEPESPAEETVFVAEPIAELESEPETQPEAVEEMVDEADEVRFELTDEAFSESLEQPLVEANKEEAEEESSPSFEITDDADEDMTFELDDIEGDGIYLVSNESEAEAANEIAEQAQAELDPFDMSINDVLGERENDEKQDEEVPQQEETMASSAPIEAESKVVHTLDDYRKLEEQLQVKSPVREESISTESTVKASIEETDDSLNFEVKIKDEPSTSEQEQKVDNEDFAHGPITPRIQQRIEERNKRLKMFNYQFKSSNTEMLEKEPAYKRQGLDLGSDNYSEKSEVSRFSLGGEDNDTQIRTNNSFLHDNVD